MRLDYSEKKGGRENIERRKNRPRKEPAGLFALLSAVVLLCCFGAGVLTGWFLPKGERKTHAAALAQPVKKEEGAPAPGAPPPATPFTFYKTLSDGGKGAIGSGLNLKKGKPIASPPRPAPVTSRSAPIAATEDAASPEEKQEVPVRFVVQIASYRDQQDADKAQARLVVKGIAAYVTESKPKEDVVWYRLRVGRHLSKAEAEEIAVKAGKGAAVLPE